MTRVTTVLIIVAAFVSGTLVTGAIAYAAPGDQGKPFEALTEKFIDTDIGDLINRIEKLESVVHVDDDSGDVTIKSDNGNLNFDAANGKKVEFKKDASFEGDTTMKKNAKVMGNTEMEGDTTMKKNAKVMGSTELEGDTAMKKNAKVSGSTEVTGEISTLSNADIGGYVTINSQTDDSASLYLVIEEFTANEDDGTPDGGPNHMYCHDPLHIAVVGSATRDGNVPPRTVYLEDNSLVLELPASVDRPVTGMLICAIQQ